uniref:Putative secreted protein n=1 Tax=Anopheles triannulatus TaxID=58253 RepID=A0A2M4B4A4_9DIPT
MLAFGFLRCFGMLFRSAWDASLFAGLVELSFASKKPAWRATVPGKAAPRFHVLPLAELSLSLSPSVGSYT